MRQVIVTKENGRLAGVADIEGLFTLLPNGTYDVVVKRHREHRTLSQNDLMWMWLKCIEDATGTPKQDIYLHYCKKFLLRRVMVGNNVEMVYDTSSLLNTKQMSDFMTAIQADASAEMGITLPSPEDQYFEQFFQTYK